jgi:hypothetical protein
VLLLIKHPQNVPVVPIAVALPAPSAPEEVREEVRPAAELGEQAFQSMSIEASSIAQ